MEKLLLPLKKPIEISNNMSIPVYLTVTGFCVLSKAVDE
jgi:hypothetical protein